MAALLIRLLATQTEAPAAELLPHFGSEATASRHLGSYHFQRLALATPNSRRLLASYSGAVPKFSYFGEQFWQATRARSHRVLLLTKNPESCRASSFVPSDEADSEFAS